MPEQPLHIDYGRGRRRWRLLVGQMLIWSVLAGLLTVVSLGIIPHFGRLLSDLNVTLPAVTVALLRFGHWFRAGHGWIVIWILPVVLPLLLVLLGGVGAGNKVAAVSARAIRRITLLLVCLVLGFIILALGMPLMNLANAIN